jgi:membrane protein
VARSNDDDALGADASAAQGHAVAGSTGRYGDDEKRSYRMPEGPEHKSSGSTFQTLKRTFSEFSEDNITDSAAALTYYGVQAIFPMIVALASVIGLVGNAQTIIKDATKVVSSIGPASAVNTFKGPINSLVASKSSAGILLIVGLLGALWSASGYVGAFMRASNVIYEVEEGRSFFKLRPLQMLVTLVLVILQALILVAVVLTGPIAKTVGNSIGLGSAAVTAWDIAKWPVMLVIVLFMFVVLYYSSPNARIGGLKKVLPGAIMALVVWLIASALFAFYVANFGSYNKTYGTLGGVIAFLVWLWITNVVLLLGAEFNAERERSRQIERGERGAERELQLPQRSEPKPKKRSRTA